MHGDNSTCVRSMSTLWLCGSNPHPCIARRGFCRSTCVLRFHEERDWGMTLLAPGRRTTFGSPVDAVQPDSAARRAYTLNPLTIKNNWPMLPALERAHAALLNGVQASADTFQNKCASKHLTRRTLVNKLTSAKKLAAELRRSHGEKYKTRCVPPSASSERLLIC